MKKTFLFIAVLGCLFSCLIAFSEDSGSGNPSDYEWYYNPGNGHYYAEIDDRRINWDTARQFARSLGGYVASINDSEEDEWLYLLMCDIHPREIWIGLYRENGSWKWDSGEPVEYTHWNLEGWPGNSAVLHAPDRGWFERPSNDFLPLIVEREGPITNVTPTPTPSQTLLELEWRYNPANGHYYAIAFERVPWDTANSNANSVGGYLATLLDESENDFVNQYVQSYGYSEFWIGLYKDSSWRWVTGEELEYSHWAPGEPTEDGDRGMCRENGWNDSPESFTPQCYVIEKSENVVSPTPTPIVPVEPVWHYNPENHHTYTLIPDLKTIEDVEAKAQELGAYVVSITDKTEETWIQNTFESYHYYAVCIGLVFENQEWRWFSGEPCDYSNFIPRQHHSEFVYAFKYINEENYGNRWSHSEQWAPYNSPTIFERDGDWNPSNLEWVYNPENGHYYAIVFEKSTWVYANQTAMELGGYLVTVRSDSEAKWVRDLMFRYGFEETWMGLWKTEDWAWITGEELDYTGWNPGEPSGDGLCGMLRVYGWNDAPQWDTTDCFVVEKDGDLPLPTPTPSGPPEYQWMRNPANGHEYAIVPDIYSWEEGVRKANELGGYIVSITSKEEDDWIAETFYPTHFRDAYIGLYWNDGKWEWMSGEPVVYTNWQPNEPNYGSIHPLKYLFEDHYNHEWAADANWKEGAPAIVVERETVLPTPTPHEQPIAEFDLNGDSLDENGFWAGAPVGYTVGDVSFGEIPDGTETNGRGMRIEIAPGEGVFAISNQSAAINGLADISGRMRASLNNISLALIALNDEMDGQYGYSNLLYQEIPVKDYRDAHLIYNAPSGELRVAVQAVNPAYNSQSATVWVDRLSVAPYDMESELSGMEDISLEVDGSFDGGLENLYFNMNDADGSIAPFFQSITDVAIRLMLDPFHRAANVGTKCLNVYDRFPFRLLGWTTVKRDSMPGSGVVGMVVTNGMQNLGVFRLADEIQNANDPEEDYLTVGGDFTVNNPDAPVYVFVQLGGPGANASIVVDDLVIVKSR